VQDICAVINESIQIQYPHKRKIVVIDGTTICLERTKDILQEYKAQGNQFGEYHHPDALVVLATDLYSGIGVTPMFAPKIGKESKSEQVLAGEIFDALEEGTLVVGDRSFGIFSVISNAQKKKKTVLFRLTDSRAGKFLKNQKKTGELDIPITWNKSKDDQLLHPQDPLEVKGRFIRAVLRRNGYRNMELLFFTTSEDSVEELVSIYGRRVDIETDIRSLKHVLNSDRILVKSRDMVAKEILLRVTAYNLVRESIAQMAVLVGLAPRQVSFSRALRFIHILGYKIQTAQTTAEREALFQKLLIRIRQARLPTRSKPRHEPRQLTRKTARFPLLKTSRKKARQISKLKI
jgi:hypothetical protein